MKLTKYMLFRSLFVGIFFSLTFVSFAQKEAKGMEVVKENLTTFRTSNNANRNIEVWKKLNKPAFYQHPEFGQLPANAPCENCVEILDRRTGDYRYFIDAKDNQKFYVQKSLGDINFQENNFWVAKDFALQPITNTIFESRKSEQKVGVDVQNKRTYIETSAGKIYFNQWKLIGLNGSNETMIADANWNDFTIGENGIEVINIFPNINAKMIVKNGSVKTNFIIRQSNFNQFDKLIFRDAMNANAPLNFNFQHSSDLIAAGEMDVKVGGVNLLEIAEGIAYVENDGSDQSITLNYAHSGNNLDVIVPMDWININISKGALVIDPLVTGTATLAQAAVTGSQFNASCNFDNSCDYPLTIPTPAQAIFTDVTFLFDYRTKSTCRLNDGAMKVSIGSCVSPSGAGFFWLCNSPLAGTCGGGYTSIYTDVSSCLPAPLCVSQNVVMTLKFYRRCKGSTGCSNDCISADSPFIGVIEGRTLEFANAAAPITLATTVCQDKALTASTSATAGIGPYTYNWSFSASGSPSLGTTISQLITFPTPGNQTVYLTVTDACGNSVISSKVVNVKATPVATATSNSPICVGGILNLTGGPATGVTYAWSGPNSFSSTTRNPVVNSVTASNAGTYSLVVSVGGCPSLPEPTTVVINPGPTASAGANSPLCAGSSLDLTANNVVGATYNWSGPNSFSSTVEDPTINPVTSLATGTYNLSVTVPGCSPATATVDVVVNPAPIATAAYNTSVCAGGSLNLTANTVNGGTYNWTGPNGFTSSNENPIINPVTAAAAGTYNLIITVPGCAPSNTTVDVVINPGPMAIAGSNSPLCVGGSLNLSANTVSGAIYSWTGPNGFSSSDEDPIISPVTAAASGTYNLSITVPGCSPATANVDVVINLGPTATAGYNTSVCAGGTLSLTANTVSGAIYSWTGPNGFTSAVQNPTIPSVTATAAGTYNLTITASGCTPATANVTVVINPGPTATATSNSPICSGSTLNLSANTVTNATYGWTGPNGFTSAVQNPTIPSATSAASGSYTLTVTTPGCSPVTSDVNVTVTANPTATAGSNSPICLGSTINLTAVTVAGATYAWTGPNSFTSTLQNPSIPSTTALNSGTYSLIVTVGTCQSAVSTTSVSFSPSPIVNVTKTDVLCNGGATGTATATPTVPGTYTYAWSPSGGTGQVANNLSPGVYTVITTNSSTCTASSTITINQPTVIGLTMTSTQTACGANSGTATVVASGGTGAYTYAWSPSGGTNATASNLATGNYSVTVTDVNGCTKVGSVVVGSANPPVITVGNVTNVSCFGLTNGSATITVNGGSPGYTYNWLPTGGNASSASNLIAGQYTVTVTDNTGCTATETINISAPAELVVTTIGTGANCGSKDGSATANVSGGSGTYTYLWTPGNFTTQTISNLATGSYNVVVTDANGCNAANFFNVDQIGGLNIQVNPITSVIYEGESVNLNATLTPYVPGLIYTWSPASGLTCVDCPNPTATPDTSTIYTITITTPDGCSGSATATVITRVNCGEYFIPTIFSPNGDGKNDEFKIYGKCIVSVDLKVYNRWGENVFESQDQAFGWDGTHKGELVSSDSYYYAAKISFQDGTITTEKGSINVVR